MTKTVFQLRLSLQEKVRWTAAAKDRSLAEFVRFVMNEEVDRLEAEGREPARAERVAEISRAFPQSEVTVAQIGGSVDRRFRPDPK